VLINTDTASRHPRRFCRCDSLQLSESACGTCVSRDECVKMSQLSAIFIFSCARLFLTPLCYLWQRDQAELISEMIDAGMEAVLVKVAGIGLKPNHLGKTLAEMESTLIKLVNYLSLASRIIFNSIAYRITSMALTFVAKAASTKR
jgi:hypothetical protein